MTDTIKPFYILEKFLEDWDNKTPMTKEIMFKKTVEILNRIMPREAGEEYPEGRIELYCKMMNFLEEGAQKQE